MPNTTVHGPVFSFDFCHLGDEDVRDIGDSNPVENLGQVRNV